MKLNDYFRWLRQDVAWSPSFLVLNLVAVAINVCGVLLFLSFVNGVDQIATERIVKEVDVLTLEVPLSGSEASLDWGKSSPGIESVSVVHSLYVTLASTQGVDVLALLEGHIPDGSPNPFPLNHIVTDPDAIRISTASAERLRLPVSLSHDSPVGVLVVPTHGDSTGAYPILIESYLARTPHSGAVAYAAPITLQLLKSSFGVDPHPNRVDFIMRDLGSLEQLRAALHVKGFATRSIMDRISEARFILSLIRVGFFCILALGVLITSFNLVITLTSYVLRRQKEIGILTIVGASPFQIQAIFLMHALVIGLLGAGFGVGGALVTIEFWKKFAEALFSRSEISHIFVLSLGDFAAVGIATVLIAVMAAAIPARSAASMSPAKALLRP